MGNIQYIGIGTLILRQKSSELVKQIVFYFSASKLKFYYIYLFVLNY